MASTRRQATSRRASITDVARLAGVSAGTVSNVLNHPGQVSERTRTKVLAAIEQLSFVRNASARQLREGTSRTVGAIVLDIANPFFTAAARGIEDRLAQDDLVLMLASSDEDPDREARLVRQFVEHGVRGLLVTPSRGTPEAVLRVRERGTDVVLLDHTSPFPDVSSVAVDDVRGAELATAHLLGRGHERIAFLNGPRTLRQCADRRQGVLNAIIEAGRDPGQVLVEVALDSLDATGGSRAMAELLARPGPPPTATFCVNDFTALGALRHLREAAVVVPRDMAVVGYDDVDFAAELAVPLTSVRQPSHEIGWRAADLLLTGGEAEQVLFQPELVVRASSGR